MDCVFCAILNGQIPSERLYEDENCIIIKDIEPIAPVHLLAIPKRHYALIEEASVSESMELAFIINKIASLKNELGLQNGYRLVINQGKDAGQSVPHLHIHILGGKELDWK